MYFMVWSSRVQNPSRVELGMCSTSVQVVLEKNIIAIRQNVFFFLLFGTEGLGVSKVRHVLSLNVIYLN